MNKYQRVLNQLVKHDVYRNYENYVITFYYSRKTWKQNLGGNYNDLGFMQSCRNEQIRGEW